MIDETMRLPCGAKLRVIQGSDPDTYVLLRLTGDRPLDKFVLVDPATNTVTVSVDPDSLPMLAELIDKLQPKKKFDWKGYAVFGIVFTATFLAVHFLTVWLR